MIYCLVDGGSSSSSRSSQNNDFIAKCGPGLKERRKLNGSGKVSTFYVVTTKRQSSYTLTHTHTQLSIAFTFSAHQTCKTFFQSLPAQQQQRQQQLAPRQLAALSQNIQIIFDQRRERTFLQ